MRRVMKIAAVVLLLSGCTRAESPAPEGRPAVAPSPPTAPAKAVDAHGVEAAANAAFDVLQAKLSARLMEQLASGGPMAAIGVCRDEAQVLGAAVAKERGFAMGRTSHALRNPVNAARPWAHPVVQAAAGKEIARVEPITVIELGDRVGVLRPIPMGAACSGCHGPAERISDQIRAELVRAYPADRAIGFEPGQVRGYFWAEIPKGAPRSGER